jgi:hypothetical protein
MTFAVQQREKVYCVQERMTFSPAKEKVLFGLYDGIAFLLCALNQYLCQPSLHFETPS